MATKQKTAADDKISVQAAIMSHLSDAQQMIQILGIGDSGSKIGSVENNRLNFVKLLLLKYPNTTTKVNVSELDKMYADVVGE